MFAIVSYDIVKDSRRTRMAKHLLDYGNRVQKSVFEFKLDKRDLSQMIEEATKYIDPAEDSLRVYYLCEACVSNLEVYGRQVMEENTMII